MQLCKYISPTLCVTSPFLLDVHCAMGTSDNFIGIQLLIELLRCYDELFTNQARLEEHTHSLDSQFIARWKPLNRQHMYFSIASVTGFRAFARLVFFSHLMDGNLASVDGCEVIFPSGVIIKFLGGGRKINPITSVTTVHKGCSRLPMGDSM